MGGELKILELYYCFKISLHIPDVESIAWVVGKFDSLVCLARVDVKGTTCCLLPNISLAPPEEVTMNTTKSPSLVLDKRWRNYRSIS